MEKFKLIPHEVILVSSIPNCNFCEHEGQQVPGPYDFATQMGPWANGCERHWKMYRAALGLGTGMGQLWVTEDQVEGQVRPMTVSAILGHKDESLKGRQLEQIVLELNTGLIDDAECSRRLDEIGASEEDLLGYI